MPSRQRNRLAAGDHCTDDACRRGRGAAVRQSIEDQGQEWPNTDAVGSEGWHYRLRATMAAAIEAIMVRP